MTQEQPMTPVEAGAFLAARRESLGLTQEQVTEQANMTSPNYLSYIENGRVNIARSKYLAPLARILRLTSDEIRRISPHAVIDIGVSAEPAPKAPSTQEGAFDYVTVRLPVTKLGEAENSDVEYVERHLTPDVASLPNLRALEITERHIEQAIVGDLAIYASNAVERGDLAVIRKDGGLYVVGVIDPKQRLVETDIPINRRTPTEFIADAILGRVEDRVSKGRPRRPKS